MSEQQAKTPHLLMATITTYDIKVQKELGAQVTEQVSGARHVPLGR